MKLGVYVGSFDPVHKAHMEVINHCIKSGYVDKVVVIATSEYWNKQQLTAIKKRIDMLKFYESDKVLINNTLNNIPYTYQILNSLKEEYPSDELYLIIGADNIKQFHLWKEVTQILKNKVLILPRNGVEVEKYIDKFNKKGHFILVENFTPCFISSTKIRECIKCENYQKLDDLLDSFVLKYILENKLYK